MIDRCVRVGDYFFNKLTRNRKRIADADFDSQFNQIVDYLDAVIKPAINNLSHETAKGVAGEIGAYLHNVGDTTTTWQKFNGNTLDDHSIDLTKLAKYGSGSILTSDTAGNVNVTTAGVGTNVLTSQVDGPPVWKSISTNNIENKTLTCDQLGILRSSNFVANLFVTNIIPNAIATENIGDQSITNTKLQNGTITSDKLGIFSDLPIVNTGLTIANIDDGAIEPSKLMDNNIPISMRSLNPEMLIWGHYGEYRGYYQILKSQNILDASIEDKDLAPVPQRLGTNLLGRPSTAFFNDIPANFQFQSNHLTLDKIHLGLFSAEIKAAIDRIIP